MRQNAPLESPASPLQPERGGVFVPRGREDLPRHVAIIMDGNGRWAQAHGYERARGHEHGVASVRAVTRHAAALGLEQLTLFAFSTENRKRPTGEVDCLMDGEFHVTDIAWPDFREADLEAALDDYASRTRSFGGLLPS